MLTTKQKPIVDTQKKRKESEHTMTEIIISQIEQKKKKKKKELQNSQKTINKIAIRTRLSIIISNINGPNSPSIQNDCPGQCGSDD